MGTSNTTRRIASRRQVLAGSSGAIAVGLAGCLGNLTGGGQSGSIEIITHLDSPEEQEVLQNHAADFEDETGSEVEVVGVGSQDLIEQTSRRARAGDPPTIALTSASNVGQFLGEDVLADVSDLKTELEGNYGEIPDNLWLPQDGGFLTVPISLNGHNVTIRTDMVEQAGFTFPESVEDRLNHSWDTHLEWSEAISNELGTDGFALAYGSTNKAVHDAMTFLWNHGVDIWTGDSPENIELTFHQGNNRSKTITALENCREILQYGPDAAGWAWGEMQAGFSQGSYASHIYSIGRMLQAMEANNPDHYDDIAAISPPTNGARSDGSRVAGSILAAASLFEDHENVAVGREWIRHFTDHRANIDIATAAAFHSWPAFPELQQSDTYLEHPTIQQHPEILEYQRQQQEVLSLRILTAQGGYNPWAAATWADGSLGNLLAYVMIEDMDPEDAIAATVEDLQAIDPT